MMKLGMGSATFALVVIAAALVVDSRAAEAGLRPISQCTSNAEQGGTWGSSIQLCFTAKAQTLYFTVTKAGTGKQFEQSGWMELQYQSLDEMPNGPTHRSISKYVHVGDWVVDFADDVSGPSFPRYYTASFHPDHVKGQAFAGPIMITNNWWDS